MGEERSVVITGTSTGIGYMCALHLDACGFRVFAGVRNPKDAEKLRVAASENLTPLIMDVTDPDSIERAVAQVRQKTPNLYALINNAGVYVQGPLECNDIEHIHRVINVNSFGTLAVTRAFIPLLRKSKGRLLFIGSSGGFLALPGLSVYSATKFAMRGITDALRVELQPAGIAVTLIEPGTIDTPLWSKASSDCRLNAYPECYTSLMGLLNGILKHPENTPASVVAKTVADILMSSKPVRRIKIGVDSRVMFSSFSMLPMGVRDFAMLKIFLPFAPKMHSVMHVVKSRLLRAS